MKMTPKTEIETMPAREIKPLYRPDRDSIPDSQTQ